MKRKLKIALIALVPLLLTPQFVRAYTVAGPSMSPTLWLGDRVLSSPAAYDVRVPFWGHVMFRTGEPRRGDLVVYFDEAKQTVAIKRVVAIPGDSIEMSENRLQINGEACKQTILDRRLFDIVPEDSALGERVVEETGSDVSHLMTYTPGLGRKRNFESQVIPEGEYFLLGDHRDNSADSRFIGLVRREQLRGKVIYGARDRSDY